MSHNPRLTLKHLTLACYSSKSYSLKYISVAKPQATMVVVSCSFFKEHWFLFVCLPKLACHLLGVRFKKNWRNEKQSRRSLQLGSNSDASLAPCGSHEIQLFTSVISFHCCLIQVSGGNSDSEHVSDIWHALYLCKKCTYCGNVFCFLK